MGPMVLSVRPNAACRYSDSTDVMAEKAIIPMP